MSFIQPAGMTNDLGVILTVGLFCNGEAMQIVQPFATDSSALTPENVCSDAVASFALAAIDDLMDCLSSGCYCAFVGAEGMVNGTIPYRQNFASSDHPGTRDAGTLPTNVSALGIYYALPDDLPTGAKMKVAKTFLGGLAQSDVIENTVVSAVVGALQTFLTLCLAGYASSNDTSANWYRVNSTPKTRVPGQAITRNQVALPRNGVYTQRRRLVPRP